MMTVVMETVMAVAAGLVIMVEAVVEMGVAAVVRSSAHICL
jgi:hypothetical protein